MKPRHQLIATVIVTITAAICSSNVVAQETNAVLTRIGVYDSRAVAYAYFTNPMHQHQINEMVQAARAAQAAGQTNRFNELRAALREEQDEIHREVFSTAPATDAMMSLKNRIPEIEKEAGVSVLISKWDDATLKKYPDAEQVDVTDRLVHEFKPTAKQLKVISGFEKSKPLPLDKCNELIRKGEI